MNPLLRAQEEFLACVLDETAPLPTGWDAVREEGMAVYRNAYRARLVDVLRDTFERTARLVGDDAFRQAAAHHLITHPPAGWTIDLAGEGFPQTCGELFANDPDVPDVAWLEWAMHCAYTAADCEPLTVAGFADATADFEPEHWNALCLDLVPGTAMRPVTYDLVKLWETLADQSIEPQVDQLPNRGWVLLWREGERPVFVLIAEQEGAALAALQRGSTYGSVCADLAAEIGPNDAATAAGTMLRKWLELGVVKAVRTSNVMRGPGAVRPLGR